MAEVIAPEGKLNLSNAAALHSELGALSARDTVVDLKNVTQLGALGVQVLISACKTAKAANGKFRVEGAGDNVQENLAVMGLSPEILTEELA